MIMRIFVTIIVLIAVTVGTLTVMPLARDQLIYIIIFRDFFDVALPILAFGALVKFLCSGCLFCKCEGKQSSSKM